jgi:hypothetical protein
MNVIIVIIMNTMTFLSNKKVAFLHEEQPAAQGSVEYARQKLRRTLKSGPKASDGTSITERCNVGPHPVKSISADDADDADDRDAAGRT